MPKKRVTVELDERILSKLQRRAEKNMMSLQELVQDIVRRSAVSSKVYSMGGKSDDTLVEIFSRKTKKRRK